MAVTNDVLVSNLISYIDLNKRSTEQIAELARIVSRLVELLPHDRQSPASSQSILKAQIAEIVIALESSANQDQVLLDNLMSD